MIAIIFINGKNYKINLNEPLDISIPLISGSDSPNCFWAPHFEAKAVVSGDWIGDTTKGGDVNFKTITINPHGNGTHTECVGHISTEIVSINKVLKQFHHLAQLVTIYPQLMDNGDKVITLEQIKEVLDLSLDSNALVIRTMPNDEDKLKRIYSGTNPPYLDYKAIEYMVNHGVEHLLLDLPSVDREDDGGELAGHKAFWNYPATLNTKRTITEMIFVDNSINDGTYLLNLQIVSFELDASPSKPILYKAYSDK